MAAYVALATVKAKLPASLPTGLSDSRITTLLGYASAEVDELAGPTYLRQYKTNTQKFPDVTDTPATPKTVELAAMWLTLSSCWEEMGDYENRGDEENTNLPNKIYYRRLAESKMKAVRSGEVDLNISQTEQMSTIDKYPDAATEETMEHWNKIGNLDILLPPSEMVE